MAQIQIEVAYAEAAKQKIVKLIANEGITVKQAVERSAIVHFFPNLDIDAATFGIFSQPCMEKTILRDGDRVEIYRPLLCDPKEMRRKRAKKRGG